MTEYEKYLADQLNLEKVEFMKQDGLGVYFKYINGNNISIIKVLPTGKVYMNKKLLNIPLLKDPFTMFIDK